MLMAGAATASGYCTSPTCDNAIQYHSNDYGLCEKCYKIHFPKPDDNVSLFQNPTIMHAGDWPVTRPVPPRDVGRTPQPSSFKVGENAEAEWGDQWYPVEIKAVNADGSYHVDWSGEK